MFAGGGVIKVWVMIGLEVRKQKEGDAARWTDESGSDGA